eukprot:571682-Pelagomonas_calceolata.AAC.2
MVWGSTNWVELQGDVMQLPSHSCLCTEQGLGLKGVGLQPENQADRLLESIDLEISQDVKACQERNKINVWKLGK